MIDAETVRTKITANIDDKKTIPDFAINGSRVTSPGWLLADPRSRGEEVELPKVEKGEKLNLLEVKTEEKQTEPPGRYSEAGLIKELEKRGIGRPSTYASIIKTIEDRGYVEKINKALVPTDTGDVVSTFLEQYFGDYISDSFTAEMEDKLDLIAEGKAEYVKTLKTFYKPFLADVKAKDKMDKVTTMGVADSKYKCPVCGKSMIIKLGRSGKFLSCSTYPDCEGALTIDGQEIKKDAPIGNDPETGLPIYMLIGKYGPYVQLGDRVKGKGSKKAPKPRMASIPKEKNLDEVTLKDALKYLSLPKVLGTHPETGEEITANIRRFGPYIALNTKPKPDFRSLKTDDVYNIDLKRALEILKEEKKVRFGRKKK
jgi:DNA topoisomerase-1